jgi:hypothetical protein
VRLEFDHAVDHLGGRVDVDDDARTGIGRSDRPRNLYRRWARHADSAGNSVISLLIRLRKTASRATRPGSGADPPRREPTRQGGSAARRSRCPFGRCGQSEPQSRRSGRAETRARPSGVTTDSGLSGVTPSPSGSQLTVHRRDCMSSDRSRPAHRSLEIHSSQLRFSSAAPMSHWDHSAPIARDLRHTIGPIAQM